MQFDDTPVGAVSNGTKGGAPGGSSSEEDFSKLPVDKLLPHSNWKARKEGLEKISADPPKYKLLFFESLSKLCQESNAATQEAFFESLVSLVRHCTREELTTMTGSPLSFAIEKGITGRPKAVQCSHQFVSLLVENGLHTEVFDSLLPSFAHKTPKNRMASAQLCAALVSDFGVQGLPLKSILKSLQPLFNDANPQVRKEALGLCCQCYKYMGAGIKGFLTDLREVQLHELEKQFEQVVLLRTPPKSIKGASSVAVKTSTIVQAAGSLTGGEQDNDVDDDTFELLDESPVLTKLPRNFFNKALDKETSWQDRCSFVTETLMPLLSAPRLRGKDDYHELASMMRIYLLDPQAPIMLLGFKMIQECARGLRGDFSNYARGYLNPLFDKMKDKKTSVLEHVMLTLEKLIRYHCVTFDGCNDEMDQGVQSKNPSQRLALLNFCIRMVEKLDKSQYTKLSTSSAMLRRMVSDEKAANRDVAYMLLQRLVNSFGEDAFKTVFASMDDKQKARMQTVAISMSKNSGTPSNSPAKKIPRVEDIPKPPGSHPRAASAHVRSSTQRVSQGTGGHPRPLAHASSNDDPISLESTLPPKMETMTMMLGLCNGDTTIVDQLRSSEWSQRHEGVMKVRSVTENWSAAQCSKYFSVLVVFLRTYPGWKESTVQVFQLVVSILSNTLSRVSSISPGAGYAVVAGCAPRLTDAKHKQPIKELYARIVQLLGPGFVMKHITIVAAQIKTPKLLQECNELLVEIVEGAKQNYSSDQEPFDAKGILEYLKRPCFEMTQPPVRQSALQLLVAIATFPDTPLTEGQLSSLPAQVLAAYEQEMQRSGRQLNSGCPIPNSGASRYSAGSSATKGQAKRVRTLSQSPGPGVHNRASYSSTTSGRATSAGQTAVDSSTPRGGASGGNEVPSSIKPIIREITNGLDWRDRLEGVKKAEEFIQQNSNSPLAPNTVAPLLKALSSRFDEANKNFVVDVLRVITLVVQAAGHAESRVGLRKLLPGAFAMLGDQKTTQREEARKVVFLGMDVCGLDNLLPCLQKPLSSDSNMARQNTLEVMIYGFENLPSDGTVSRAGLQLLIPSVVRALMDRILEVRVAAEQVIAHMLPITGDEPIFRFIQQLKPADQQSVTPAVERQLQLYTPMTHRSTLDNTMNEEEETPVRTHNALRTPNGTSGVNTPRARSGNNVMQSSIRSTPQRLPGAPPTNNLTDQLSPLREAPAAARVPANANANANGSPKPLQPHPSTNIRVSKHTDPTDSSRLPAGRSPSRGNEEVYSIPEIMLGLRSASPEVAYAMCTDFMKHFRQGEDCGTPEMMQIMVERLYDNTNKLEAELAIGLVGCLSAMFVSPRSAKRCHSSLLFRLLGNVFDCLLSEQFALNETVIKSLNNMTLKLLEGCAPNDVFSALLSRMTNYSTAYLPAGHRSDLKYLQVTVKCIMRLDLEQVSPDNVVLCCHEYLLQHPPSAFRQLDDLPIRTVKTILQTVTRRHGAELLATADRLVGPQNLVTHFIRACLENNERSQRHVNEMQAEEEMRQQRRASQSPAPVSSGAQHVDPTSSIAAAAPAKNAAQQQQQQQQRAVHLSADGTVAANGSTATTTTTAINGNDKASMSSIFSRIRNHVTSSEGIDELYVFLRAAPRGYSEDDFNHQFNRCSEAFRLYIKRKLDRKVADDKGLPPGFQLPAALASLS